MKRSSDVTIDCVHYDMIYQQQAIDARKRFANEYAAVSTRTRTWLDEKLQDRDGFAFAEFIKSGSVQKTQYKRINRKNYDVPIWEITRRFELLRALKTAEGASKEQLSIQCIWVAPQNIPCKRSSTNVKNGAVYCAVCWLTSLGCLSPGVGAEVCARRVNASAPAPGTLRHGNQLALRSANMISN